MRNYTPGCLISWQSMAPKGQRGGSRLPPVQARPRIPIRGSGGAGAAQGDGSPHPRRGPRCPLVLVPYVTPTGTLLGVGLVALGRWGWGGDERQGGQLVSDEQAAGTVGPPHHLIGVFPPPAWPSHCKTKAGSYRSCAASRQDPVPGAARERCRSRGGASGGLQGVAVPTWDGTGDTGTSHPAWLCSALCSCYGTHGGTGSQVALCKPWWPLCQSW